MVLALAPRCRCFAAASPVAVSLFRCRLKRTSRNRLLPLPRLLFVMPRLLLPQTPGGEPPRATTDALCPGSGRLCPSGTGALPAATEGDRGDDFSAAATATKTTTTPRNRAPCHGVPSSPGWSLAGQQQQQQQQQQQETALRMSLSLVLCRRFAVSLLLLFRCRCRCCYWSGTVADPEL